MPGSWVLFAIALMGPLAFLDPEEVTLLLDARDVPFWAGVAALCGLLVALLLGLAWTFGRRVLTSRPGWAWGLTVVVVVAGTATHIGWGQPGFHGERLFVIMAEQADLTGLPSGAGQAGRDARATEVYRRLVDARRAQPGRPARRPGAAAPAVPAVLPGQRGRGAGRAGGAGMAVRARRRGPGAASRSGCGRCRRRSASTRVRPG